MFCYYTRAAMVVKELDMVDDKVSLNDDADALRDQEKVSDILSYFMEFQQKFVNDIIKNPQDVSDDKVKEIMSAMNSDKFTSAMDELKTMQKKYMGTLEGDSAGDSGVKALGGGGDDLKERMRALGGKLKQLETMFKGLEERVNSLESTVKKLK